MTPLAENFQLAGAFWVLYRSDTTRTTRFPRGSAELAERYTGFSAAERHNEFLGACLGAETVRREFIRRARSQRSPL